MHQVGHRLEVSTNAQYPGHQASDTPESGFILPDESFTRSASERTGKCHVGRTLEACTHLSENIRSRLLLDPDLPKTSYCGGVFTLGDARSFFWSDVKIFTIGLNVQFSRQRHKTTSRHQCENRLAGSCLFGDVFAYLRVSAKCSVDVTRTRST